MRPLPGHEALQVAHRGCDFSRVDASFTRKPYPVSDRLGRELVMRPQQEVWRTPQRSHACLQRNDRLPGRENSTLTACGRAIFTAQRREDCASMLRCFELSYTEQDLEGSAALRAMVEVMSDAILPYGAAGLALDVGDALDDEIVADRSARAVA